MAGIMVSASTGVMTSLLVKLGNIMGEEFSRLKNLRKEVKFISEELTSMKDALERLSEVDELDKQTKRWRDQVREMSFDIEDIIDDFMHHVGGKREKDGFARKTARLLKKLRVRNKIASRIEEIKALVLETNARRQRYKLDIPSSSDVSIDIRVTALYENAANLVGINGPTHELINWLNDEEKRLKVASIVGFGGLGKTTLANEVYRRCKGDFDHFAFASVSQKPDINKLLRNLLSELESGLSFPECELNVLLNKLREHLQNKRYLIIIDDIWKVQAWSIIKCAFPENGLGSRVIVTTRIHDVAKMCCSHGHDHILEMKPLSNEDSRKLFFSRILGLGEACPRHLRDVSVGILKKCGGLPLAIISISSMLASEGSNQKERWDHVYNSLGSGTDHTLDGMRKILNLSYRDLPPHLKTCLLYLGMYPEDYIIKRSNLERQWIAEGFFSVENGQDVQKVARNVFNQLVNRSLIQPIDFDKQGSVLHCKVHDMMLDLILLKSVQENFLTVVDDPGDFKGLEFKARRLSIRLDGASNGRTILPRNISLSQVRSVMFFGSSWNTPPLSEFKSLRVIFMDLDYATMDLTGLCKMYQLRYLRISESCFYQLPAQISMLQHLETLDLLFGGTLPSDIIHLPRLMHLNVSTRLPDGISNLKSLRHLCEFYMEENTLENIKGLGELTNLRRLCISCGHSLDDWERRMGVLCSSLGRLYSLEGLFINVRGCIDGLMPPSPPLTPYHLERLLMLGNCWFSRLPRWMGELHNLMVLECKVDELLHDGVGILADLPALTHLDLKIRRRSIVEMITIYGGGVFPALKSFNLQLNSASYLSFEAGAMPKLQRLKLMFNVSGLEQSWVTPTGIEHLSGLEELSVEIGCCCATESEKRSMESSLRSVFDMHPSHPRVEIDLLKSNWIFFDD